MLNKSVARRYAESLFAIAQEQNQVDEFQKDLGQIADVIDSSQELKDFMAHVLIPPVAKKDIVARFFTGKVSATIFNFLNLVIEKRRAEYIGAIYAEYRDMADESHNVLKAEFVSARKVSDEDVSELEKSLSAATGKNVRINVIIDPSLIGGVKVRIGDRVIDASVLKKLERLKSSLQRVKIS
jgi:F-type H+-transporting ATPase subunit delta